MALFRAWGMIDYGRSLLRVAAISSGLAAIYGIEAGAIVMELVEGPDLAGPVPIDTAIA